VGLIRDIGPGPVALDTVVFIYFIEENPDYLPVLEPVFNAIARGELEAVTSELTLLEVLVEPYRQGRTALAEHYEALLSNSAGLRLLPLDRALLRTAARIRARDGLRTPDAIQAAAALVARCTSLLTNDRDYRSLDRPRVLQLDAYRDGTGSG
jgi:predicted nucleic acid-binding protein